MKVEIEEYRGWTISFDTDAWVKYGWGRKILDKQKSNKL